MNNESGPLGKYVRQLGLAGLLITSGKDIYDVNGHAQTALTVELDATKDRLNAVVEAGKQKMPEEVETIEGLLYRMNPESTLADIEFTHTILEKKAEEIIKTLKLDLKSPEGEFTLMQYLKNGYIHAQENGDVSLLPYVLLGILSLLSTVYNRANPERKEAGEAAKKTFLSTLGIEPEEAEKHLSKLTQNPKEKLIALVAALALLGGLNQEAQTLQADLSVQSALMHHSANLALIVTSIMTLTTALKKEKKLMDRLFPKTWLGKSTLEINQGGTGNCYFFAALLALYDHDLKLFKETMESLITETDDPEIVAIQFPTNSQGKAQNNQYLVCLNPNRESLPTGVLPITRLESVVDAQGNQIQSRHLTGAPLGIRALETAFASHVSRVEQNRDPGLTVNVDQLKSRKYNDIAIAVDGGYPNEALKILLGDKVETSYFIHEKSGLHALQYSQSVSAITKIKQALQNPKTICTAGTLQTRMNASAPLNAETLTRNKATLAMHGLVGNHAYSIVHYDETTETVQLRNPHSSKKIIALALKDFLQCFSTLFINELESNA